MLLQQRPPLAPGELEVLETCRVEARVPRVPAIDCSLDQWGLGEDAEGAQPSVGRGTLALEQDLKRAVSIHHTWALSGSWLQSRC